MEDVETLSAMVKVVQEKNVSTRESEYCDLHERRILTWNGGGVEKDERSNTEQIEALQSAMKPTGVQR